MLLMALVSWTVVLSFIQRWALRDLRSAMTEGSGGGGGAPGVFTGDGVLVLAGMDRAKAALGEPAVLIAAAEFGCRLRSWTSSVGLRLIKRHEEKGYLSSGRHYMDT